MSITEKSPINVTFFLFSYNQEEYIEDACRAALAQTYSPLEIIFSDDFSTDQTFDLIQKIANDYRGPHKVKAIRNSNNLGLIAHVNKSFETAIGQLLVFAAGDDISLPDRVETLVETYRQGRETALIIHSSVIKINHQNEESGILIPPIIKKPMSLIDLVDSESMYIGATAAVSKSLYNEFGPIVFRDAYEDLVFGFRAAIKNSLVYVDKPLVRYRVGIGISARPKLDNFNLMKRIKNRTKKLNIILAVLKQRLIDINHIHVDTKFESIRNKLIKSIDTQKIKISMYQNPLFFLKYIFSGNLFLGIKLFASEMEKIFMPDWKIWLGQIRFYFRRLFQ